MKHLFVFALGVALLATSCVSKSKMTGVESQRDSLTTVVNAKDSLINAIFADINTISDNLTQIKTRENLITVNGTNEGVRRPVDDINNDITAIDRLLQDNKAKIASLQSAAAQLRKANARIDGLETMIENLNGQLADKTTEVNQLRDNLSKMGIKVEALTEQVAVTSARADSLKSDKVSLEDQLHTVYYIVGQEKELRDAQIVDKQGFIGRTLTVKNTAALGSFTKADSRLVTEVPVGQKKVTLVSSHPEGTYELVTDADKTVTELLITDPDRFWSTSKILVISYK